MIAAFLPTAAIINARRAAMLTGLLVSLAPLSGAAAGEASAWQGGGRAAVRLIAGEAHSSGVGRLFRAGIEVKLGGTWKTYWRYPGDSGVPPRFGFERSQNVADVVVGWPAPAAFDEAGQTSIGYKQQVIFPLRIVPRDPARPVLLRVDFEYAVCEKICVPAEAKLELEIDGSPSAHDADLQRSELRVARKTTLGAAGPLAVTGVQRNPQQPNRVVVELNAPEGMAVELFAEGPTSDWALPVPTALAAAPTRTRRFAFDLDGVPPGATARGAMLKLTAVTVEQAIEVEVPLP